jgi:hypothetical protein
MSDHLRRYRAIRAALRQGYPGQPTGRARRCRGSTVHSGRKAYIPPHLSLTPTRALSRAISTAGAVQMKENSAFSSVIEHDSLVQRQ